MPVIANQAGNAGQQSLAVTLRDRARRDPGTASRLQCGARRPRAINGVIGGTLVGLLILVSGAQWRVGCVAATSMAFALALGCFAGSTIPILMRRFGADPATASTIFLTMVTDSTSFLAFLGSARMLAGWLLPAQS
jgi:magnesium transporter